MSVSFTVSRNIERIVQIYLTKTRASDIINGTVPLVKEANKVPLFEVTDLDRRVYEDEIRDFLPDKLIDIHTHVWRADAPEIPKSGVSRTVAWPSLVARDNSLEDLQETYALMFPGKTVTPLMFASTDRAKYVARNAYVESCARRSGYPSLYYSLPEQSGDEVVRQIRAGGFLGLKSYLDLAPEYIPESEIRIFDFFPPAQLEAVNDIGAIVMLHIPRGGRLRDPVNIAQIREIKRRFPRIKLIIAHIGRAYARRDVGDAFERLADCGDLMFDFTATTCEYAMTRMLESVGSKRCMFGSDLPILRMRMRRIEENDTYINLIPPGLYGDPRQDSHLREESYEEGKKLTFFMYEEIRAFRRAAEAVGLTRSGVEDAFHNNARALLDAARRDIYGE